MKLADILLKLKESKKATKLIVIIGFIGILLIAFSSLFSGEKNTEPATAVSSYENYAETTNKQLEKMLSDMLGGSKVTVMVTLKNGPEYVYASETKNDTDKSEDKGNSKTEQSDKAEESYIIVKDSEGNEKPVIVKELMPAVKGVLVVCDSGEKTNVSSAVKIAVKAVLDVDEKDICVIGRYN